MQENERPVTRSLEEYEAHILKDIGIGGIGQKQSSQDLSANNSKDSDFSNNFDGSEAARDFGGNRSQSNSYQDEFSAWSAMSR